MILSFIKSRLWQALRPYRRLRARPHIVALLNRRNLKEYAQTPRALSEPQRTICTELAQYGIAITHLDTLFPGEHKLVELHAYAGTVQTQATLGRKKKFLNYVWGQDDVLLDLTSPFVRLAVSPTLLGIVNEYMGLFSRFVFSSLNITNPMEAGAKALGSQRWHRDPSSGDKRFCKIFIYLNNVDSSGGPFQYLRESHQSGRLGHVFPAHHYDGFYPAEGAAEQSELWQNFLSCEGSAGTVIFCDTTGMHRGGYSTATPRTMSTFFYVSPGSVQKPRFSYPPSFNEALQKLPEISRLALQR